MGKVKGFVITQAWMRNELNLRGYELNVFAIIYGYSIAKDGEGVFHGSLQYLADWCGIGRPGICRILNLLLEKDLIRKETEIIKGVKRCKYWVNPRIVAKYRHLDFNGNPDLL